MAGRVGAGGEVKHPPPSVWVERVIRADGGKRAKHPPPSVWVERVIRADASPLLEE
jgi:hypothetical protein